jgi:hypothetical protein
VAIFFCGSWSTLGLTLGSVLSVATADARSGRCLHPTDVYGWLWSVYAARVRLEERVVGLATLGLMIYAAVERVWVLAGIALGVLFVEAFIVGRLIGPVQFRGRGFEFRGVLLEPPESKRSRPLDEIRAPAPPQPPRPPETTQSNEDQSA